jgi:Ala-tRNA(Pro) deacylase
MSLVTENLDARGVRYQLLSHPPASTARDEAEALQAPLAEVVKTIVLDTAGGHAIAVVPGSRRLDMSRVRQALGDDDVRIASESELVRDFPGYSLGAIPPLGSMLGIPEYDDPEVLKLPFVVFAVSRTESIRVRSQDLFQGERTVAPLVA